MKKKEVSPRAWLTSKEPKCVYAWKTKLADLGDNMIRMVASTKNRELAKIGLKYQET